MQIQDRGFIVTGSGSSLGAATARRLMAAGGRVLLVDLNAEAGQALAAELGANAAAVEQAKVRGEGLSEAIVGCVLPAGGHPIGCSGARLLVTLVHALRNRRGIVTLCLGGGEATAVAVEVA